MADAWALLIEHSTLTTGDAWAHLNNQEGGGASPINPISCPELPMIRQSSRLYATKRVAVVNAIVKSLSRLNGIYPFKSDVEGRVYNRKDFIDSIEVYPTIFVNAGFETRNYLGAGYKDRYLNITISCYIYDQDSSDSLGLLLEEVETILDSSSNITYFDNNRKADKIKKLTILNILTEEVNMPYMYGEITCEVMY